MIIITVWYFNLYCIYMKVMFPQHIKKWFFSWVAFSVMWFSVSFIQLIVLAIWVIFSLWAFSTFNNSGEKWVWFVVAVIILAVFLIIAFFNVSELNLVAFIAKKVKDNFFDVQKKFQVYYSKNNPTEIIIEKSKQKKWKKRIEIKEEIDISKLDEIERWWIL